MPTNDETIAALNPLAIIDVASGDYVPIYDVSAQETKRVDAEFFLGSSSVYDVTDYGAVGDGATDDSDAIMDCINDAPAGSAILVPGTPTGYKAYGLVVDKPYITLLGSGWGSGLLKPASGVVLTIAATALNFVANAIRLGGVSGSFAGTNIVVNARDTRLINVDSGTTTGQALECYASGLDIAGGSWSTNDGSHPLMTISADPQLTGTNIDGVSIARIRSANGDGVSGLALCSILMRGVRGGSIIGCPGLPNIEIDKTSDGVHMSSSISLLGNAINGNLSLNGQYLSICGNQMRAAGFALFGLDSAGCTWYGNSEPTGFAILNNGAANNSIVSQRGTGIPGNRNRTRYGADDRLVGAGAYDVITGVGSPEGVVTAGYPAIYYNEEGTTNGAAAMYVKGSGSGNTGWVAK